MQPLGKVSGSEAPGRCRRASSGEWNSRRRTPRRAHCARCLRPCRRSREPTHRRRSQDDALRRRRRDDAPTASPPKKAGRSSLPDWAADSTRSAGCAWAGGPGRPGPSHSSPVRTRESAAFRRWNRYPGPASGKKEPLAGLPMFFAGPQRRLVLPALGPPLVGRCERRTGRGGRRRSRPTCRRPRPSASPCCRSAAPPSRRQKFRQREPPRQ
jgi:hypothetical protein